MSERSIAKAVEEYNRYTEKNPHKGSLFLSDINQIVEIAQKSTRDSFPFSAIHTALQAGFAIGYRTAQREIREKRNLQN